MVHPHIVVKKREPVDAKSALKLVKKFHSSLASSDSAGSGGRTDDITSKLVILENEFKQSINNQPSSGPGSSNVEPEKSKKSKKQKREAEPEDEEDKKKAKKRKH